MCGAFAGFCATSSESPRAMGVMYHLGRLLAYGTLGGVAGVFGSQLDEAAREFGITWISGFLVGIILILSGTLQVIPATFFSRYFGWIRDSLPTISSAHSKIVKISSRSPKRTGLLLGISASLLPCGWLYTFVLLAGSMGGILQGIVVMVAFWAGTLPILIVGAGGVSWIFSRIGRNARTISALCIICAGIASLFIHLSYDSNVMTSCH
jgi:sulfite exporter TauE/SafE